MTETPREFVFYAGTSAFICDTLHGIVNPRDFAVRALASEAECRDALGKVNCALLIVDLDGHSPAEVRSLVGLRMEHPQTPVIVLVDHGNIPVAVEAIKGGASNCLEKPIDVRQLTSAIDELLDRADPRTDQSNPPLTPTEITVLGHILEGKTSRQIARVLCRSPRTIEVHRSHIMHKLGVSTMVDLIRAASAMGLPDGP